MPGVERRERHDRPERAQERCGKTGGKTAGKDRGAGTVDTIVGTVPRQEAVGDGRRLLRKQTNAENFYYQKQMQSRTPMVIVLQTAKEVHRHHRVVTTRPASR